MFAAALTLSCSGAEPTRLRVSTTFPSDWALTHLEIDATVGGARQHRRLPATAVIVLLVPDAWAGRDVRLFVTGFRGTERWATGLTNVSPALRAETSARVTLARIPCGAWCTAGAKECAGNGVATCVETAVTSCRAWSVPVPCTAGTTCSLGACAPTCIDECAASTTRCDGPFGTQACGEAGDGDPCREWLARDECPETTTCSNGACSAVCADSCAAETSVCAGNGVAMCGDLNRDGCRELGPSVPCESGDTCSAGRCAPASECVDECETSACDDLRYVSCANTDADSCLERAAPVACTTDVPCHTSSCSSAGCGMTRTSCDDAGTRDSGLPDTGTRVDASVDTSPALDAPRPAFDCRIVHEWSIVTVFERAARGASGVAIAVDQRGYAHIVYDLGVGGVHYTSTTGGLELAPSVPIGVGTATIFGAHASIAVDARGTPHVAYDTGARLWYAQLIDGAWRAEDVRPTVPAASAIAIDSEGQPHILYSEPVGLWHAWRSSGAGSAWTSTRVVDRRVHGASLVIDAGDTLHAVYYDYVDSDAAYVSIRKGVGPGPLWALVSPAVIASAGRVGVNPQIAIGPDGTLSAAFLALAGSPRPDYSEMQYASRPLSGTSTWAVSRLEPGGAPGRYGDVGGLATDLTGVIHAVTHARDPGELLYLARLPDAGMATGGFNAYRIATSDEITPDIHIAVEPSGRTVHVVYLEDGSVRYGVMCPP